MSTVLIAGCGYVGTALARRLVAAGHRVVAVRRNPEKSRNIDCFKGDLATAAGLQSLPTGIERVALTLSPDDRTEAAYVRAYLEVPQNVLAFLRRRGDPVRRVVLTTSTGVFGQCDGAWVDEGTRPHPTYPGARIMLEGEDRLARDPFPSVALRLAGIYGPERLRLVRQVHQGQARRPTAAHWTNRIHREDCAGALEHLLFHDAPSPLYLGVDDEPTDLGDLMNWLADQLDVPRPPTAEDGDAAERTRPRNHKRCRNTLLRESGYTFRYPTFRDGYGPIVQELKSRP